MTQAIAGRKAVLRVNGASTEYDSFSEASTMALTAHTADTNIGWSGSTWLYIEPSADQVRVSANPAGGSTDAFCIWNANTADRALTVYCDIARPSALTVAWRAGLFFRANANASTVGQGEAIILDHSTDSGSTSTYVYFWRKTSTAVFTTGAVAVSTLLDTIAYTAGARLGAELTSTGGISLWRESTGGSTASRTVYDTIAASTVFLDGNSERQGLYGWVTSVLGATGDEPLLDNLTLQPFDEPIAELRGVELSVSRAYDDASTANWPQRIPAGIDWRIRAESMYLNSDTPQDTLRDALTGGTSFTVQFHPTSDNNHYWSGPAYVEDFTIGARTEEAIVHNITVIGNGTLTETTA